MAVVSFPNPSAATPSRNVLPDNGQAITPSDADTFAIGVEVYAGGAGVVVCTPWGRDADVSVTVPAGGKVPFRVKAVKATGTTATLLVAAY